MKSYFQRLLKKENGKAKTVFLFCNIVLLVAVMVGVWGVYNPVTGQIILPPPAADKIIETTSPSTEETIPTESTTTPTDTTVPIETTTPKEDETTTTVPETTVPETTVPPTTVVDTYPIEHIVQPGESWYSICRSYFDNYEYVNAIAYTNKSQLNDCIFVDQIIIIEDEETLKETNEYINSIQNGSNNLITFFKGEYGYSYGTRPNPAIDITVSENSLGRNYTGEVDVSEFEFVGEHFITAYDPYCTHCCSGTGLMASGVYAVNGYSVAAGAYPLGTTLYIEGYGFYVVEDRGVEGKHIDIAAPSHEACYDLTAKNIRVYIVPNNN